MNSYAKEEKSSPTAILKVAAPISKGGVFADDNPVHSLETVLAAVFGQLIFSTKGSEIEPGLLKRFSWDFENKWYILELQDGVRFHNGRLANADDLEFSLVRGLLTPKVSWYKTFFSNVEGAEQASKIKKYKSGIVSGISKVNDRAIRIKLNNPNPSFLHSLARSYFTLVPKEELETDYVTWKKFPIGAGPYKVKSCSPGCLSVVLKKVNTKSFGANEIRFGLSAKASPDIDLTYSSSKTLNMKISDMPSAVTGIYFNFDNKLGKNPHFRKAISLAMKRAEIIGETKGFTANNELLSSQFWGRVNEPESYNLEQAKAELELVRKDIPKGKIKIPVLGSSSINKEMIKYLIPLAKQLFKIGLNVEFFLSQKKYFNSDDIGVPMRIMSLGADLTDPTVLFGLFRNGSPLKPHYPKNDPSYDILFEKCSKAESLEQKTAAVREISKYFIETVYAVPLFEKRSIVGVNPKTVKTLGLQDGGNLIYLDRVELN